MGEYKVGDIVIFCGYAMKCDTPLLEIGEPVKVIAINDDGGLQVRSLDEWRMIGDTVFPEEVRPQGTVQ